MKRYKHNLSHYNLTTTDMGKLIPIGMVEALPGDTFQHHANILARVSPLAAPVMHPVSMRVHHFFVPTRLTWDKCGTSNWEDFITGGDDGNNADTVPTIANTDVEGDLLDHFGLPRVAGVQVSSLPIRAFNMIYNEYYRDQDLVQERDLEDTSVPNIAWEKDYFTSARPWPQKGSDVTIPLGTVAPVEAFGGPPTFSVGGTTGNTLVGDGTNDALWGTGGNGTATWDDPGLYTDLSNATGANINDVRRAFAIQRYQEARARYGSRYTEYLRYLGVTPADSRLDRPEFLGGGTTQINFSEVLQTAEEPNAGGGPPGQTEYGVGDMYGHGIAAMRSNKYRRFIEEHGFIISCLSVRPKAVYQNGIHRTWLRQHKEDFFQKELAHIGQQEILNNEIFADPVDGNETFGYQDRYMEYRNHPSKVCSEFRNQLNYWHLARDFADTPVLNQSFTDCVPSKRIHNVQTEDVLWIMCQHKMVARRLVEKSALARVY